jgi:uncharacterized membrane protein YczE
MLVPPQIRGNLTVRSSWLLVGLFLFAFGIVLLYESRLGLSPWDVLNQGVAKHTPLSFGTANIAIALALLLVARRLRTRIGPGTIANAILIGVFIDLLLRVDAIDSLSETSVIARGALLVTGIAVIGLGSALYIGAAFGAGPRDSVMLGLSQLTGVRIGAIRALIEVSVTVVGFALGGTVGIGTLAFALGIGPTVEVAFWALSRSPIALGGDPQPPVGGSPAAKHRAGAAGETGERGWAEITRRRDGSVAVDRLRTAPPQRPSLTGRKRDVRRFTYPRVD